MAYTTIDKPTDYFNTKLYTGNGSTQSITGVGFQPDWCWFKMRSHADSHVLIDSVRGTNKAVYSDLSDAESTQTHYFSSFDSDGFSLGNSGIMNASSRTYASWNWLASNTTASNTDGSITSTVSANTTSGFSIVKFTKTDGEVTVGHGLNAKPSLIIFKPLASANWIVTPEINGSMANNYLLLHSTDALGTGGAFSNPTNSVFSISNNIAPNSEHIAYCFANKKGFSKFGKFTGNGSTDGAFIYTGFKPAFWLQKRSDGAGGWVMYDNKRAGYNPKTDILYANDNAIEDTSNSVWADIVSNGFKYRTVGGNDINNSGNEYIYMAFAENPFVTSTGIPTTAR